MNWRIVSGASGALLVSIACWCVGCSDDDGLSAKICTNPNPDAPNEPKVPVSYWKNAYICDQEVDNFTKSICCESGVLGGDPDLRLVEACDPCIAGSEGCTDIGITDMVSPGLMAGYNTSSCITELQAQAGQHAYVCHFSKPGCYSPICCNREGGHCNPSAMLDATVLGCKHTWTSWRGRKCRDYGCEGRPYIVKGEVLVASNSGKCSINDAWGMLHTDLSQHTEGGLSERLRSEALLVAERGPEHLQHVSGTLALEQKLPELLDAARRELASMPAAANETQHWWKAALAEHASVGSFAKLCLELLVVGAPLRLVRRAIRAQDEEVLHAHVSLALSDLKESTNTHKMGTRLSFPEHSLQIKRDLVAMHSAAINEGIVGEGNSALSLFKRALAVFANGSSTKTAAALGELLWAMALDEARHAALAAETVEWLEEFAGLMRPEVQLSEGRITVQRVV